MSVFFGCNDEPLFLSRRTKESVKRVARALPAEQSDEKIRSTSTSKFTNNYTRKYARTKHERAGAVHRFDDLNTEAALRVIVDVLLEPRRLGYS